MSAYLITDVAVFTGDTFLPSALVLIEEGKIAYVGVARPAINGHEIISKPGHTLLPGLIDAHVHAIGGDTSSLLQSFKFGLTTVLEMGNFYKYVPPLRKLAAERFDAADYKTACAPITIEGSYPRPMLQAGRRPRFSTASNHSDEMAADLATWPTLRSPADAKQFISQSMDHHADYIKLIQESGVAVGGEYPSPAQELQAAVVDAAHQKGLKVIGHALSLSDTLVLLRAGVDGTAHTFFDQSPSSEVVEAYRANNAWCNPTLVLIASYTAERAKQTDSIANDNRVNGKISSQGASTMCKCLNTKGASAKFSHAVDSVKTLKAAGIDIICGTDASGVTLGTTYGASLHQELHLLVEECGFTPLEALRSATALTAKRFGMSDRGKIEVGRRADMLLVEGDVTKDIHRSLNTKLVWKLGVMTDISS